MRTVEGLRLCNTYYPSYTVFNNPECNSIPTTFMTLAHDERARPNLRGMLPRGTPMRTVLVARGFGAQVVDVRPLYRIGALP